METFTKGEIVLFPFPYTDMSERKIRPCLVISDKFPEDFMFQLSKEEFLRWKSHFAISNSDKMGLRKSPFVFTEHGVY